jgi:hypothetical protein
VTFAEYDRFCTATRRGLPKDQGWDRGEHYALATEAQWEYACRAGSTTRWCYGDEESALGDHAWYYNNAEGKTHPVGEKPPNAWHLYDIHGNVWEWCRDWWSGSYYQELIGSAARTRDFTGVDPQSAAAQGSSLQQSARVVASSLRVRILLGPGRAPSGSAAAAPGVTALAMAVRRSATAGIRPAVSTTSASAFRGLALGPLTL